MKATFLVRAPGADGLAARLRPVLLALGRTLGVGHCTLSILMTDDDGIREYNERFRGEAAPTDVLSFPAGAGDASAPGHYLGDLVVSLTRAAEQAALHGHGVAEEVEVLVLHGVLHLLGHDHETDQGEMRELESRLAREVFGSERGLIARVRRGKGRR